MDNSYGKQCTISKMSFKLCNNVNNESWAKRIKLKIYYLEVTNSVRVDLWSSGKLLGLRIRESGAQIPVVPENISEMP